MRNQSHWICLCSEDEDEAAEKGHWICLCSEDEDEAAEKAAKRAKRVAA